MKRVRKRRWTGWSGEKREGCAMKKAKTFGLFYKHRHAQYSGGGGGRCEGGGGAGGEGEVRGSGWCGW